MSKLFNNWMFFPNFVFFKSIVVTIFHSFQWFIEIFSKQKYLNRCHDLLDQQEEEGDWGGQKSPSSTTDEICSNFARSFSDAFPK